MSYTYAGRYGAAQQVDANGKPLPSTAVTVYQTGTKTLASLFTDRTKATAAANPVSTDSLGNLTFFADPGSYDLTISGLPTTNTVSVPLDPSETSVISSTAVGGDVSGTISAETVAKIEGFALSSTTPTSNQALVWDSSTSEWTPTAVANSFNSRTGAVVPANADYTADQVGAANVFNVKSATYGAKGDGTTDDTAAIQSVITAVESAGGGIIFFPYGTYLIATGPLYFTTLKNCVIAGTGWGSSLKVPTGLSGTQYIFATGTASIVGVTIRDLDLYVAYTGGGWSALQTGAGTVTGMRVENVRFRGDGYTTSVPYFVNMTGTAAGDLQDIVFRKCRFENNGAASYQINGILARGFTGLEVDGCTFVDVNNPIVPDNTAQKVDLRFTNNTELYTVSHATIPAEGPDIMGCTGVVVTGNVQYSTTSQAGGADCGGILIDTHSGLTTSQVVVADNVLFQNPIQFAPQNGAAITDCVVRGNTVNAGRSTSGVNSGIVLGTDSGSSGSIYIDGNVIAGSYTGSAVNLGSGYAAGAVTLRNNLGYNPVGSETVSVPTSGTAVGAVDHDRTFYVTTASGTTSCTLAVENGPTVTAIASTAQVLTVFVPAGKTLTPTYAGTAPTWVVEGN